MKLAPSLSILLIVLC